MDIQIEEVEICRRQAFLRQQGIEPAGTDFDLGHFTDGRVDLQVLAERQDGAALVHRSDMQMDHSVDVGGGGMRHEDLARVSGCLHAQSRDERRIRFDVENLSEPEAEVLVQLACLVGTDMDDTSWHDAVPAQHRTDIDHRLRPIRHGGLTE